MKTKCTLVGLTLLLTVAFAAPAFAGKKAFIVAIDEYKAAENFPKLPFAESSSTHLSKLLNKLGYDVTHLMSSKKKASKQQIIDVFQEFVDSIRSSDEVFVALIGHGWGTGKSDYFCPFDGQMTDTESLVDVQREIISKVIDRGRNRIIVVDACRGETSTLGRLEYAPSATRPRTVLPIGTVKLFSCQPGKVGWYPPPPKEGEIRAHDIKATFFMHCILRGLEGAADTREDRASRQRVTIDEWTKYVTSETRKLAKEVLNVDQQPDVHRNVTNADKWLLNTDPQLRVIDKVELGMFPRSSDLDAPYDNRYQQAEFYNVNFRAIERFGSRRIANMDFSGCRFIKCDLRNVEFRNCTFFNAEFIDCDLRGMRCDEYCYAIKQATVIQCRTDYATHWGSEKPRTK